MHLIKTEAIVVTTDVHVKKVEKPCLTVMAEKNNMRWEQGGGNGRATLEMYIFYSVIAKLFEC